jgi:hypothetical protein
MENTQRSGIDRREVDRSELNRLATTRSNKWAVGTATMLLSASLLLAACGGGADPVVESTVVATAAAPAAAETPAATEAATEAATPAATEAASTPTVSSGDAMTDTEEAGGTDAMTGTAEAGSTDAMTDTEGAGGTDAMTGTAEAGSTDAMTDTEGAGSSETMTGTEGAGTTGATGTSAAMMGVSGVENQYVRASTLLDYDFENMGGDVSGDLEDLLIDLSTGRVLFASIEYGGVLDLGDKDIVVPLNAFAIGEEGELVLNIDETALESYPDVGNDWPNLDDPAWDDDVNTFWSDTGIEMGEGFSEATGSVARASDLLGFNVADLGAGAGSILDILVNLGTGQAPYAIVDYGEGLDTDPYIIPLAAFDTTADWSTGLAFGPDFTPDLLESAPRFDMEMYPEGTPLDNDFGDNIESAWNDLGFSNDLNNDGQND